MQISKNAIELDIFNFNKFYNLNYSRAFVKKDWAIVPKVGVFIGSFSRNTDGSGLFSGGKFNALNAGVEFIHGREKHFLSLGVNTMVSKDRIFIRNTMELEDFFLYGIEPSIGYRFQKRKKGIYFSVKSRPFTIFSGERTNEFDEVRRDVEFFANPLTSLLLRPGIGYSF